MEIMVKDKPDRWTRLPMKDIRSLEQISLILHSPNVVGTRRIKGRRLVIIVLERRRNVKCFELACYRVLFRLRVL